MYETFLSDWSYRIFSSFSTSECYEIFLVVYYFGMIIDKCNKEQMCLEAINIVMLICITLGNISPFQFHKWGMG